MYKFKIWVVAGLCFISVVWLSSAVRPNLPNETNEPDRLPLPTDAFSRGISLHDYEVKYLFPYLEKRIYDQEGYAKKRGWAMDKGVRNTGPFINGKSYGVHPAVRIFYSPEVYRWLKNGRVGVIPDGAMIIKEMLPTPSARYEHLKKEEVDATVKEWTVMIKDSKGARDGWFWSYYGVDLPADTDSYPFDYPNSGFGNYCIRCHASAVSEFTFSSLDNILGEEGDPIQYFVDDSWQNDVTPDSTESHANLAEVLTPGSAVVGEDPVANSLFLKQFDSWEQIAYDSVRKIPSETYDHVVAPGMGISKKSQSNQQFLTSDQCMSCHDGNGAPFGPNMLDPSSGENLSPYGEWNWSMMGLAGRDPIFFAQIESEMALQPQQSKMLMNTCFRCHGVMGKRQLLLDKPGADFNKDMIYMEDPQDELHKYGALARDGISCTVCHQITDEGDPLDSIMTGLFKVNAPSPEGVVTVNGPFENPSGYVMESSLGFKPVHNKYVQSSRVCASCHTIKLPVFDSHGAQIMEGGVPKMVFEQATYLEWENSTYQDQYPREDSTTSHQIRTCQQCHMPDAYPWKAPEKNGTNVPYEPSYSQATEKLAFYIANIQDQRYPEADYLAPLDSITITKREGYRRHTLQGINIWGLEMFNQFDKILGVRKSDYMTGSSTGLPFAIKNSDQLAKQHTAEVTITDLQVSNKTLAVKVRVTNLAGHRFPSGVGFRRAFLNFDVLDGNGRSMWSSGRTNAIGVLIDPDGKALASEFFERDTEGNQIYEPHYERITRQDQVQIYQELVKDPQGAFTTSFIAIDQHVKDNRLLPIGWTKDGPEGFSYPEATMPHGLASKDKIFLDGSGADEIIYQVDLSELDGRPEAVYIRMFYQSIPPYYLDQRFKTSQGKETQRLHYLASHLKTEGTPIEGWKLLIASKYQQL